MWDLNDSPAAEAPHAPPLSPSVDDSGASSSSAAAMAEMPDEGDDASAAAAEEAVFTRQFFPPAVPGDAAAGDGRAAWLRLAGAPPPAPTAAAVAAGAGAAAAAAAAGKKSRRGPRSRSSQYRGVTFYRRTGRWESHIWDCGKQVYLGGFDTAHAAARAYDRAAIKFRGMEADINFSLDDYQDIKQVNGQLDQGGVRPRAPAAEHGVPPGQLQVQGRHPAQVRQMGGSDGPVPRQEVRLLGPVRYRGGSCQVVRPRCHQVQRQGCGDQFRCQQLRRGVRALQRSCRDGRRRAEPRPVAGELGGVQQEGQSRRHRRRRRRRGGVRSARPHGVRARLADGGRAEHQGQVRPELDASSDAPSSPANLPAAVWPQASPILQQQRRSGDTGRPVADGGRREQWRRQQRALASSLPPASPPATATEAARWWLGQRRPRHELAAAAPGGGSATQQRRHRRSSCSIITIPTLRRNASPELAAEERVPLPGQTHLARLCLRRPTIDPEVCVCSIEPATERARGRSSSAPATKSTVTSYYINSSTSTGCYSFFFFHFLLCFLFLHWVSEMDLRTDGQCK